MLQRTLPFALCLLVACEPYEDSEVAGELVERCGFVGEVGLVGLESVDISGNPSIFGANASVFSNERVTLSGSFDVEGYAISGGTVSVSGSGSVGGVIEGATRISVDDPRPAVLAAATSNDNATIPCVKKGKSCKSPVAGTSLALSSQSKLTLQSGSYYFTSVSVSGQAKIDVSGDVVIYLAGPATFNGGSATNPSTDSMRIVSSSTADIKLNGNSTASTSIFAPLAQVRFAGTNGFHGSAVARALTISGTADLEPMGQLTTVHSPACGGAADGGRDGGGRDGGDAGGADGADGEGGSASGGQGDGDAGDGDAGGADAGGADAGNDGGNGGNGGNGSGNGNGNGNGHKNRDEPPNTGDTDGTPVD